MGTEVRERVRIELSRDEGVVRVNAVRWWGWDGGRWSLDGESCRMKGTDTCGPRRKGVLKVKI